MQRAQARREDLQAGPAEALQREGDETEDEGAQEDVEVVEVEDEDPMEACETEVHTPAEEAQEDTEMIVLEGIQKGPPSIDKLGNPVQEGMQKGPPSVDKLDAVQERMQKGPPGIDKLGNAVQEGMQKGPPSVDKLGNAEVKGDMADMIAQGAGALLSAKEEIRRLGAPGGRPQDKVTELFSPPRVNARLQGGGSNRKMSPGTSFGLAVDETTGESWDFLRADQARMLSEAEGGPMDGHRVPAVHGIRCPEHWPEQVPERAGEVCQAGAGGQDLAVVRPGHLRLAGARGAVFYTRASGFSIFMEVARGEASLEYGRRELHCQRRVHVRHGRSRHYQEARASQEAYEMDGQRAGGDERAETTLRGNSLEPHSSPWRTSRSGSGLPA